ncbi:dihydrofolate reductase [Streptomyces sp. 3MP-14]|uniref:Dihydrofolate reductase n=1 Tax=Streptomyces mimosae TaxID=2586635 RepID=A0A5N6AI90_9ACTN|nr:MULTISPECIES: dihydrofolate reductase family protein [Streptomyces]KAB8167278.1 dihydrofolate reductase [Streptomyces mimosae]KAB8177218.1 dihydrofolate reductase [Streptomyces sp. 3MP-14]
MRVVALSFVSLDGVVQAPGGPDEDTDGGFAHGGWAGPYFDDAVVGGAFDEAVSGAKVLLFGRRTWSVMATAWQQRAGDPFADRLTSLPKYVVSDSVIDPDRTWANTTRIPRDQLVPKIEAARGAGEGDIVVQGSSTVVRALLDAGLVDELRLLVMPVLLGGGKSIFPENGRHAPFELVSTRPNPAGTVVNVYRSANRP